MKKLLAIILAAGFVSPAFAQLPDPGMDITQGNTALVITDPQNDFLSPKGVTWGVVGESVTKNNTVRNIESLLKAAKASNIPVFVSPHYYYPTDKGWQFEGALETLMHTIGMFDRKDALSLEGFENSGADFLAQYKPYINDGQTVVTSPHKVYGPENRQGNPCRDVGKPVHGSTPSRAAGAGIRGCGRQRRHRGCNYSRG